MPIKFSTVFIASLIITMLATYGPLGGGAVIGGVLIVMFFVPSFWMRFGLLALLAVTLALPALAVAILIYVTIWLACALTGRLEQHIDEVPTGRDHHDIVDAEYTEVTH